MRRGYAIALGLSLIWSAGASNAQEPPGQQQTAPPATRLEQLRNRLRGNAATQPTPPPAIPVTGDAGRTGADDPDRAVAQDPPEADTQLGPDPPRSLIPEAGTIGLPSTDPGASRSGRVALNLGLEAQEGGTNPQLFEDPQVLRMLGDNPRFIYDANNRPDPMVFPPVRNAAIHGELTLVAEKLEAEGNLREAALTYQQIVNLEDPRFMAEARQKVSQLITMIDASEIPKEITEQPVVILADLPSWVPENMSGIIFNGDDSMVLIGDLMLRNGESLANYPDVTVHKIYKDRVVFAMNDREFEIKVKDK